MKNTPKLPRFIVRQDLGALESRVVAQAAMLLDIQVQVVALDRLGAHVGALQGGALPVGSVEFVRACMLLMGLQEPPNLSYPPSLRHLLHRDVRLCRASEVRESAFVKPVKTKTFTGFVFDPARPDAAYSEHDREQLHCLRSLPPDDMVWVSTTVDFVAEWRCYIMDGRILGIGRYDPNEPDDVPEPPMDWLEQAANHLRADGIQTCSLDVGLLSDGRYAVVECNDAWALGLYGRSLDSKTYLQMLWARWEQLLSSADLLEEAKKPQREIPAAFLGSRLSPCPENPEDGFSYGGVG